MYSYQLEPQDIPLERRSVLRLLGRETAKFTAALEQSLTKQEALIRAKSQHRYFVCRERRSDMAHLLVGEDIQRHLGTCPEVVILAVSLGPEPDLLIRRAQLQDMGEAMVLDAVASAYVEALADAAEERLRKHFRKFDLVLSTRFAPGYGDFPLSSLQGLLEFVFGANPQIYCDTKGLMQPLKSIVTVLGLMPGKQLAVSAMTEDACSLCFMAGRCALRSRGGYCGNFKQFQAERN
ncbi:MAG: hypothetical protein Q4E09_05830 [Eubacteriales bacterium]|nr:hypothetical protein [Eubacteriales bacterium]